MDAVDRLNEIMARAPRGDTSALSAKERVLYLVNAFLFELDVGGLSGFLYNASPSRHTHTSVPAWAVVEDTIAAVRTLGDAELARTLDKALELVRPGLVIADETWGDVLARVDPVGVLDGLESKISLASEGLWDRLYAAASDP